MELEEDIKINVFKYYSPTYGDGVENTGFKDGEIFFQNPEKFNDPWDSKGLNFEFSKQLNKLIESNYYLKLSDETCISSENDFNKYFFDDMIKTMGVFCLSFSPDSELMWSHYARNHEGYVVHFQFTLDELHEEQFSFCPVYYFNKTLNFFVTVNDLEKGTVLLNGKNYTSGKNKENLIYSALILKSQSWSYEKEIRLILAESNPSNLGVRNINKKWIKSIITGLNINDEFKGKLETIVHNSEHKIELYHAKKSKDFKIEILDSNDCPKKFEQYCGEKAENKYSFFKKFCEEKAVRYKETIDFIEEYDSIFENLKKEEIEVISKE